MAIAEIWNNCDRSVFSVPIVSVCHKSTPQIMHHAFKTWCIVSMNGRYAKNPWKFNASRVSFLFGAGRKSQFVEYLWNDDQINGAVVIFLKVIYINIIIDCAKAGRFNLYDT